MELEFFTNTDDFRQFARGIDASTKLSELTATFRTVKREIVLVIGNDTWELLREYKAEPPAQGAESEVTAKAVEYLQSALANLIMAQHFIFLTVKKNKTDGDVFKYQYDEMKEGFQTSAWAAMNDLLDHLDANTATFTDYAASDPYLSRQELIFTNYRDFEKYFGIDSSSWFFTKLAFLIREVTADDILPRIHSWDDHKDTPTVADKVKRALAYQSIYLALDRFDFLSMPTTFRSMAGNEGNRTIQTRYSDDQAKLMLAEKIRKKAVQYLDDLDILMRSLSADGLTDLENINSADDGFYHMT